MPNRNSNEVTINATRKDMDRLMFDIWPYVKEDGQQFFMKLVPPPDNKRDYNWCVKNRGTKWDFNFLFDYDLQPVHNTNIEWDKTSILNFSADTAWAPPLAWLQYISKKYNLLIDVMYSESWMNFSWHRVCEDWEVIEDTCYEDCNYWEWSEDDEDWGDKYWDWS